MEKIKNAARALGLGFFAAFLCGCWFALAGGAEGGYVAAKKEPASQTMRDQWIHLKVGAALLTDSCVSSRAISITVKKSVVTLRGVVNGAKEELCALKDARSVKEAKAVVNHLVISH